MNTMKKYIFSIFIALLLFLCLSGSVYANDTGYIIQLKEGYVPDASFGLELINEGCRLYYTDDRQIESKIGEHIEVISENYMIESPDFAPTPYVAPSPSFSLASADTYYSRQWALGAINAEYAWNMATYGNDIKVAVIDSGYSYHPDLNANVLQGENFFVTVGNGVDDFSAVDATDVTDNIGHGTHVSGIIAAVADNSKGIAGIAPKAKIVPFKCFDKNPDTGADYGTSLMMLAEAICAAVDEYGCQIINMSWVASENTDLLKAVIDYAYGKGAILVAAAGNDGNTTMYYPAGYNNVIGAASIASDKTRSSFSNYNTSVTVAAPGSSIISTYIIGSKSTYASASGTSQATPMISAMAAIALSAKPDLTNAEFMEILTQTATDLGDEGYDTSFGYGLVNVEAMLNKITENSDGYTSPVNYRNGNPYFVIKNTSGKTNMKYLAGFADYNETKTQITYCNAKAITLGIDETAEISHENVCNNQSVFFWSIPQMKPLWYKRQ